MKRLSLFVLILVVAGALWAQQTVTVGVFLHPPFVTRGDTNADPQGAGVEYVRAMLEEMGYNARFVVYPFPRLIRALQSGQVDVSFDLLRNPEREGFAYFSDDPVLYVPPALIFRADSPVTEINSVHDLQGMTVGYVADSTVPPFMDVTGVFRFDLISGDDWVAQNLTRLLRRRIDVAFDLNPYSFLLEAKRQGVQDEIRVIPIPGDFPFYVLFSKASSLGTTLVNSFNSLAATTDISYGEFIEDQLE